MKSLYYFATLMIFLLYACSSDSSFATVDETNLNEFHDALKKHLNTIKNKDYEALKETLPDSGRMDLILPNGMMVAEVSEFLDLHKEWFADTTSNWSMESVIHYTKRNGNMGIAMVESTVREPDRNGKPYMHRMAISYVLEKQNNKWVVISDHASTLKKTE